MAEETIGRGMAKKQVLLALRRLAFYHATMVEVLKEELGERTRAGNWPGPWWPATVEKSAGPPGPERMSRAWNPPP